MKSINLVDRDLKHIWHPCSQMKDYLDFPPLVVKRAKGPYITLDSGQKIIDGISSWWCKNLGHNHPRLKKALIKQLSAYEHVIAANTYQRPLIELSEKLAELCPSLNKIFYASEGSTAVEIAVKMSLHIRYLQGNLDKTEMMALRNGYHGESVLAMSVSDLSLYRKPYESLLHPVHYLHPIPYVSSIDDPLFHNCSAVWPKIEAYLQTLAHKLSFIIFEPIVQGVSGMQIYSADFLKRLAVFAKKHDIHLISDEIMTGFGRTGKALACDYANIQPDFVCLSKGLTAGFLPMSAVLTHDRFYDLCFDDYHLGKSFLHSNTFSGNALAASVAVEHLKILEEENIYEKVGENAGLLRQYMLDVSEATAVLCNVRSIGAIAAADLQYDKIAKRQKPHFDSTNTLKRYSHEVYRAAVKMGALLRPLGNTLYWAPPLNSDQKTLIKLRDTTIKAIKYGLLQCV